MTRYIIQFANRLQAVVLDDAPKAFQWRNGWNICGLLHFRKPCFVLLLHMACTITKNIRDDVTCYCSIFVTNC